LRFECWCLISEAVVIVQGHEAMTAELKVLQENQIIHHSSDVLLENSSRVVLFCICPQNLEGVIETHG
jgi:hypothetical protein